MMKKVGIDLPSLVILPAINEEKAIGLSIKELNTYLTNHQILVVDGGSCDNAISIAKSLGVKVISQKGIGKGNAIKTALESLNSSFEYLILVDTDFTYLAIYIPKTLQILEENSTIEMISGKRIISNLRLSEYISVFYFGNKLLALIHSLLNRVNLVDPLSGLRVVRWKAIQNWLPKSGGFDIEVGLNTYIKKIGYTSEELPIQYRNRIGKKKLGIKHGLEILQRMIVEAAIKSSNINMKLNN